MIGSHAHRRRRRSAQSRRGLTSRPRTVVGTLAVALAAQVAVPVPATEAEAAKPAAVAAVVQHNSRRGPATETLLAAPVGWRETR